MLKMADPEACRRRTTNSIVLLLIIFCLGAHFLVEDIFLNLSAGLTPECRAISGQAFAEMEHLDDLGMSACLPQFIQHTHQPAISARSIHLERQLAFPIYIPPKIT